MRICSSQDISWEWDPITQIVILGKNGREARLRVGDKAVWIDGNSIKIQRAPYIHDGEVMVPLSIKSFLLSSLVLKKSNINLKNEARTVAGKEKKKKTPPLKSHLVRTIIIDPGHGGKDPGAIGRGGIREKDVVLDIAKRLKAKLEKAGVKVVLTRDKDVFISLWKRAKIANDSKGDFFISIHANASRSRRARGFETYYLSEKPSDDQARVLAEAENAVLQFEDENFAYHSTNLDAIVADMIFDENRKQSKELAQYISKYTPRSLKLRNRGVKSARFYVLKGVRMPAVLVESAFITSPSDAKHLTNKYFRDKLAAKLAEGILAYKRKFEITNGFTR